MDINTARKELEMECSRLFSKPSHIFIERLIDLIKAERDELRKIDPTVAGARAKKPRGNRIPIE